MRMAMFFVVCSTLPLALAGCGANASKLKTVPVSGKVTYNDAPVEGAVVTFQPKNTQVGFLASGTTNAEGQYKLSTYESANNPLSGAVPGEYTVTVTKTKSEAAPMQQMAMKTPEQMNQMSPEEQAKMAGGPQQVGGKFAQPEPPKSLLPTKYGSADSPLTATITSDQKDGIDFQLKD